MRRQTNKKERETQLRGASPALPAAAEICDLRFRALLGEAQWSQLSLAVQARFSKRLSGGATAIYAGTVTAMRMSRTGWLMAQALRLIGGPLPTSTDTGQASVVSVTEDGTSGGQIWSRLYTRRRGFPQIINSCKRFAGPTGLEEHLGHGFAMSLRVTVEQGAILFRSVGYVWQLGRIRFALPRFLWPGDLTITHRETGQGRFAFDLDLVHRRFGSLLHQSIAFEETFPWSY